MNELGALLRIDWIRAPHVLQASPATDDDTGRRGGAKRGETTRGERREPGVETVIADVECAEHLRLETRRRKRGELRERLAK